MHSRTLHPQIVVAQTEHLQLYKLPLDIVRMGSHAMYRTDDDDLKEVTPVYPAQADIVGGRVSVLTSVGVALIGLKTGQSITCRARNGSRHVLTVLSVIQPMHVH